MRWRFLMQDIYIDKVKIHNCRGHIDMEMDFPVNNFTIFIGKNGAGKSTIFKAIMMSLYGDDGSVAGDRLTIDEMVNRKEKKDLEIITNFRVVENGITDNYEVQLYYEHKKYKNKFILFKNGIDVSGKTKDDTYRTIENTLIPRDVFVNTVYFSQQVKDFFTSLTNTKQKLIFDSILSTQEYSVFYNNASASIKTNNEKLIELDKKLTTILTTIQIRKDQSLAQLLYVKNKAIQDNELKRFQINEEKVNLENQIQNIKNNLGMSPNPSQVPTR